MTKNSKKKWVKGMLATALAGAVIVGGGAVSESASELMIKSTEVHTVDERHREGLHKKDSKNYPSGPNPLPRKTGNLIIHL